MEPCANPEAERAILGCVLLANTPLPVNVTADDFSLDSNRLIFREMEGLEAEGSRMDMITVAEKLGPKLKAIGGISYLSSLTEGIVPDLAPEYIKIVKEKSLKRRMAHMGEAFTHAAVNGSGPDDLRQRLAAMVRELDGLLASNTSTFDIPDPLSLPRARTRWTVGRIVPAGGVAVLAGEPKSGKSLLGLRISQSVASGSTFLDRECEQREVYILDREMSLAEVQEREQIVLGGPTPHLHWWGTWCDPQPPMICDPRLLALARQKKPFMLFDTLTRFHTAKDENSSADMKPVMDNLRLLASAGASILVLHHRGKGKEAANYRGSSEILGGVDAGLSLTKGADGLLCLHAFAMRGCPEWKASIRADLSCGEFELADSPGCSDREEQERAIVTIIRNEPGITARGVIRKSGLAGAVVLDILHSGTERLWFKQDGPRNSHLYFPLSVPVFSGLVRNNETVNIECSGVPAPLAGGTQNNRPERSPDGELSGSAPITPTIADGDLPS